MLARRRPPGGSIPSKASPAVVVYHAEGCHLCQRALKQVGALREELGFSLTEVDISGDADLERRYREWIPVVEIDGERAFVFHVHEQAFRRRLAAQSRRNAATL